MRKKKYTCPLEEVVVPINGETIPAAPQYKLRRKFRTATVYMRLSQQEGPCTYWEGEEDEATAGITEQQQCKPI